MPQADTRGRRQIVILNQFQKVNELSGDVYENKGPLWKK